jgi:hypothetical protein
MKSSSWFGQALIAIILVAAGAILWRSSEYERRLAAAERDLVTLKYEDAAAAAAQPGGRLANLMPLSTAPADAKALASTAGYWRGDYDKAIENPGREAARRQRAVPQDSRAGRLVAGRRRPHGYGGQAVRGNPARESDNTEAAFNYEYVVRLRAVLAARKLPVPPLRRQGQRPHHSRLRGRAAEESDMKKFKMIVPMRPDERLEAEKAGKGTTKVRKGRR